MAAKPAINRDYLPPKARELERLIGFAALMRLVKWRGGLALYVPASPADDHDLVRHLGHAAAKALAEEYGGDWLQVPSCKSALTKALHDEIRARRAAGETEAALAREYGLWDRSVRRICAGVQVEDKRQGGLF